ncbi:sugar transferase [Pararhodobacter marinus]|uniref:Sugar transferase n=1 Tax=Pararhodobacter marinus TaxID=2184063 RepID=A0A2U2C906_9RHOB|nr:sugar transferase [Pararhodobacter marinus]PWE28343.1 sugar transferase [Pararhodobacter marinus]
MNPLKRAFDLWTAAMITPIVLPLIVVISLAILITDGRPIFYGGERMKTPTKGFSLWKFRSMKVDPTDSGVSGGDKSARITPIGRWLRKKRLDELPQLWNLWRGDISVVGPRPPLRQYVEQYPDIYNEVLKCRPGLTGFATIYYSRHEYMLLGRTTSRAETDAVYRRNCVPRKARIDMMYQRNWSFCFDLNVVRKTLFSSAR